MIGDPRSSKKLVIFDLDGTLIDLPIDYDLLKQELSEKLKFRFQNIFPTVRSLDPEKKKEAFLVIDRYEQAAASHLRIKDGAIEILKNLSEKGFQIAIVTMQGPIAKKIVKNMNVSDLIESVTTREDSLVRKQQISLVLNRQGFTADEAIMVGDKADDYNSATELGLESFLVRKTSDIPYYNLIELKEKMNSYR